MCVCVQHQQIKAACLWSSSGSFASLRGKTTEGAVDRNSLQELGWKQPRVSRIHLRIEREKLVVGHQGFHMNHSRVLSTACQTYSINSAAAAALPGSQMTWETGLARRGSRRSGRRRSSNLSVKRDSRSRRPDKCWAQRQNPSFGGKPVHR